MADVTPPSPQGSAKCEHGSRGQLLTITGLVLAITLVVLAVLLNSVIYSEKLSTRGSEIGGSDVAAFESELAASTEASLVKLNDNVSEDDDREDLATTLNETVEEWGELAHMHVIRDGTYTNVTPVNITTGTRIAQTNGGTFESANDQPDWLVVDRESRVRDYVIEADNGSLVDDPASLFDDPFHVNVDGTAGGQWTLSIHRNLTTLETVVSAETPDTEYECRRSGNVTIDFSNSTVNGDQCDAAAFAEGVEGPYTIRYVNGDGIEGNYSLVVDDENIDPTAAKYDGGSPDIRPAVYSTTVAMTYETNRIEYRSILEIVPGEIDD